jgi:hypothetical protein
MTTYWITKRERCPKCDGRGYNIIDAEKDIAAICEDGFSQCSNGYIETQINLLDVLAKMRWRDLNDHRVAFDSLEIREG